MAYIGRGVDKISNIEVLDAITFTDSAGPYNLLKDTVAFTPTSPNALVISIDGVIQSPDSYTIASATITFDTSMSSASTNDFIYQMGVGILTAPSDASVTAAKLATDAVETAKIKDLNVTAGKLAATQDLSTKTITLPASVSGLGTGIDVTSQITGTVPTANLGSGTASSSTYLAGDQTYKTITEYDDSVLQSNVAMLGFKVAVNGSLTRYNLVDQSIDEFYDTSGVDASASTNDNRVASGSNYYYSGNTSGTATQDADDTGVDGDYTWYKWTDTAATGSYSYSSTANHDWLVLAGGGGGGASNGGGGGAGGFRAGTSLSLTGGNTYTVTVGDGGTGATSAARGTNGSNSELSGTGITTVTSTGGGGGGHDSTNGATGGSGGGAGYNTTSTAAGNTPAITPITGETTTVQGYLGGGGFTTSEYNAGGGGGACAIGVTATTSKAGDGGVGCSNSITGSAVYYGGGGGGSVNGTNIDDAGNYDTSGVNGGTRGGGGIGSGNSSTAAPTSGTDGLGSGGGSCQVTSGPGGDGGSGTVILRRLTAAGTTYSDMTLQSTDVTAVAEPDFGEFVTLIENAAGTATLNTDIKGYISRDSGTTFTQGTLVDEGTWGTNKKILGFHDLDISSQPSGTSMCYKITTHNQSVSKQTGVYATSIGWR